LLTFGDVINADKKRLEAVHKGQGGVLDPGEDWK